MHRRTVLLGLSASGFAAATTMGSRLLDPERMPLRKVPDYERNVYVNADDQPVLVSLYERLNRLQTLVGHGNFNVIGFDEARRFARLYATVGEFTKSEEDFFESLFVGDASRFGFRGDRVTNELTATVAERDRVKLGRTGHYLFRGTAENIYKQLQTEVGDTIIVTSGIRSVVKQAHLFLARAIEAEGNLTVASRSIAPPGHSYHAVGDFDVGKAGFGNLNFTMAFSTTEEFKRLAALGYVSIRYGERNHDGVRFEPWHIKVT